VAPVSAGPLPDDDVIEDLPRVWLRLASPVVAERTLRRETIRVGAVGAVPALMSCRRI